jgi:uncharacterized protein
MALADDFDLGRLRLSVGEGRRLPLDVRMGSFSLAGERYATSPGRLGVVLDVSRMAGPGYALRLRFEVRLAGPCMRCLEEAAPGFAIDVREVDQPGGGEEVDSPYVSNDVLDLVRWAHDALALALPTQILCRTDCAGLCGVCGENLNEAGPDHFHDRTPDPRWAKLSELRPE